MPPFRQNLTGATGTTLTGAHGGVQQLGAAAQRRLAGGAPPTPAPPDVRPTGQHPLNPAAGPPPFSGPGVMGAAGMVAPPAPPPPPATFLDGSPGFVGPAGGGPGPGLSSYLNGGAAPAIAQAIHSRMMSESGAPGPNDVGGGGGGMANFAPGGGEGPIANLDGSPGAMPMPKTPPIMDPAQKPGRDPATGGIAAQGIGNTSRQVERTKPGVNSDAFAAAKPKPKTPRTGQGGRINQLLKRARAV